MLRYTRIALLCSLFSASSRANEQVIENEPSLEQISLASPLKDLLVFDESARSWEVARSVDLRAPVLILHVWADWCKPCVAEFPLVRDLAEQMQTQYPGKVQTLFLTETQGQAELAGFLFRHRASMPKAPVYQSKAISDQLLAQLDRSGLPMPITLVLDDHRVVRLALLGSVAHRRSALARAVARLAQSN